VPSAEHEAPVFGFAEHPGTLVDLLDRTFKVGLPPYDDARRGPTAFPKGPPTSYHVDNSLVFSLAGKRQYAVALEVQRRWDEAKWRMWKFYATSLERELDVGVLMVVFCTNPRVAARYRSLAEADGYSVQLRPYILTAADLPLVLDPAQASVDLPLAALSLLCQPADPAVDEAFEVLYQATRTVDLEQARAICDMVLGGLPEAVRVRLEAQLTVMESKYRSEYFRTAEAQGLAKGRAEGKAEGAAGAKRDDLLAALDARGVDLPQTVRAEILACEDLNQLDTWFHRALKATTLGDVFAE
jgi:hypothetical protein